MGDESALRTANDMTKALGKRPITLLRARASTMGVNPIVLPSRYGQPQH